MYAVEDKAGAVAAMMMSLVLLGSWPACFSWAEKKGRLYSHTYLDYSITFLLTAVVCAFTLGELGPNDADHPNFLVQLSQHNWQLVVCAFTGGALLMFGNLSMQYGVALTGLAICLPLQASMTVVIGSAINYFLDGQLNDARLLVPGVVCFLSAILLGSFAHLENARTLEGEGQVRQLKYSAEERVSSPKAPAESDALVRKQSFEGSQFYDGHVLWEGFDQPGKGGRWEGSDTQKAAGLEVEGKVRGGGLIGRLSGPQLGLFLTCLGGVCFGGFSPAFNIATNDQLHLLRHGVPPLTVYTAYFYFSCAFFLTAAAINCYFLYYPPFDGPKSSVAAYLANHTGRGVALAAGVLAGLGNALQFVGGEAAGFAAADMVQAFPLVSTLWGVLFFNEFRGATCKAKSLLVGMYAMYVVAVVLLGASARPRHHPKHP